MSEAKQTRRVHVSRDMLQALENHVRCYHDFLLAYTIKGLAIVKDPVVREQQRKNSMRLFVDIQQTLSQLQEAMGENPFISSGKIRELVTSRDFKLLDDEHKVRMLVPNITWRGKMRAGWFVARDLPVRAILWCIRRLRK